MLLLFAIAVNIVNQSTATLKTNWKDLKATSPELKIFLSNVAISLFGDTSRKAVYGNFPTRQRE